jgi:uncharacterized Fe-S cluster-containing radical SAM superfamily protein
MLKQLESFRDVFDVDTYFSNRINALSYLLTEKDSVFLAGVYQYFRQNVPEEMNEAEQLLAQANH